MNVTEETVSVKLCGNYFMFKPQQIKKMNPDLAKFIQIDRRDSGLAVLPDLFSDDIDESEISDEALAARKAEVEAEVEAIKEGVLQAYLQKYKQIVANNQIHLRRDLEQANIKADPASFASDGELDAMRILAKYQRKSEDASKAKADEVKKLMAEIEKKGK